MKLPPPAPSEKSSTLVDRVFHRAVGNKHKRKIINDWVENENEIDRQLNSIPMREPRLTAIAYYPSSGERARLNVVEYFIEQPDGFIDCVDRTLGLDGRALFDGQEDSDT